MDRRTVIAGAGAGISATALGAVGFALAGDNGDGSTTDSTNGVTGVSLGVRDATPGMTVGFGSVPPSSVVVDRPDGQRVTEIVETSADGSAWVPLNYPISWNGDWTLRARQNDTTAEIAVPVTFGWDITADWTGEAIGATITHNGTAPVNVAELRLTSLAQGLRREQTIESISGDRGHHLTRGETITQTLSWANQPEKLQLQVFRDKSFAEDAVDPSLWEFRLSV